MCRTMLCTHTSYTLSYTSTIVHAHKHTYIRTHTHTRHPYASCSDRGGRGGDAAPWSPLGFPSTAYTCVCVHPMHMYLYLYLCKRMYLYLYLCKRMYLCPRMMVCKEPPLSSPCELVQPSTYQYYLVQPGKFSGKQAAGNATHKHVRDGVHIQNSN